MMNQSQLLMAATSMAPRTTIFLYNYIPQLSTQPCFFHPQPNSRGDGFRADHDAQQQACLLTAFTQFGTAGRRARAAWTRCVAEGRWSEVTIRAGGAGVHLEQGSQPPWTTPGAGGFPNLSDGAAKRVL